MLHRYPLIEPVHAGMIPSPALLLPMEATWSARQIFHFEDFAPAGEGGESPFGDGGSEESHSGNIEGAGYMGQAAVVPYEQPGVLDDEHGLFEGGSVHQVDDFSPCFWNFPLKEM